MEQTCCTPPKEHHCLQLVVLWLWKACRSCDGKWLLSCSLHSLLHRVVVEGKRSLVYVIARRMAALKKLDIKDSEGKVTNNHTCIFFECFSVTQQTHKCCMGLFFFPDSPSSCCTEESTLYGGWFGVTWCKYQCKRPIWENVPPSQCREWLYTSDGGKIVMWCWNIRVKYLLVDIV